MRTWMKPEDIMLNEMSEKDKYHMISLICKILHTHTNTHRTQWWLPEVGVRECEEYV